LHVVNLLYASSPRTASHAAVRVGVRALLLQLGASCLAMAEGPESPDSSEPWTLSTVYTADLLRNSRGGLAVGNAYLDNLDVSLEVDGERAFGVPGLQLFAYGLYNNSARFSEELSGDAMTASNIDAARAVRLYEAWADWTFGASDASMRFGLYDLNSEFDTTEARSVFLNSTFGVGHELGQTGHNGPSIFPSTSLALRMAFKPAADWALLVAAFDGVPNDPERPAQTRIRIGGGDGALLITELQRHGPRLTKLAAGAWHYTEHFERIDDTLLGSSSPRKDESSGAYVLADLAVWQDPIEADRQVEAFARAGVASAGVSEFDSSAQLGIIVRQPFGGSADESLGFAVATARTGEPYRRAQRALGAPIDDAEAVIEVTYRRAILPWLTVQPDVQYILNPGADRSLRNALVFGLRIEFSAEWAQ
jgi:porin